MTRPTLVKPTRRSFLRLVALLLPAPFVLAVCGRRTPSAAAQADASPGKVMPPTPACGDEDDVTPRQTEGPYYTPDSPARTSFLEPGIAGTTIVVSGSVLTTECKPVAGALLDFWHADDRGRYDNVGYELRGHQFTDEKGRYTLTTIVPGTYGRRTRHFHVKVQAPNQPILTTQLYFPNEPRNAGDGIFDPSLLLEVQDVADGKAATFDFVLALR